MRRRGLILPSATSYNRALRERPFGAGGRISVCEPGNILFWLYGPDKQEIRAELRLAEFLRACRLAYETPDWRGSQWRRKVGEGVVEPHLAEQRILLINSALAAK